ncbi:MAG: LUD domain-containing protein [Candidatus Phosphoribacter sp.]
MTTSSAPSAPSAESRRNDAARAEILSRVRGAVTDIAAPFGTRGESPRIEQTSASTEATVELFVENVIDYKARVVRVAHGGQSAAIAEALAGATSVLVPAGLDPAWTADLPDSTQVVQDDALSNDALDAVDAVITSSTVSIATTGTIVLDHGPGQGRRALSLVPDLHVCVVSADQVVHDVPEAVARLRSTVDAADGSGMPRPLTWISGPSATSDIELDRVEGVHGPRTLHVILVEP